MSTIALNSLTFYYDSPVEKLFNKVTLNIDTDWKLGLVGKNGRGKTTLLKLLLGKLHPVEGSLSLNVKPSYFPYTPDDTSETVFNIIKDAIAPFRKWEERMDILSTRDDDNSQSEYGDLLTQYSDAGGYEIDSLIEKETAAIGLDESFLKRKFVTLSGGEQTRALLAAMFLKNNGYPLIDEPTNHLDIEGRRMLADYLNKKDGYLVVSHDRNFLDKCTDHILSINRSDVTLSNGNYSTWKYNTDLKEGFELRKNENLKREIKTLEESARVKRAWSSNKEKEKKGAYDKGFVGHRAAKMMKRALSIENRVNADLAEKKNLLKNYEKKRHLKLESTDTSGQILSVYNIGKSFDGKKLLDNVSFTLYKGDRVAISGANGTGKTTLLKILSGELQPDEGSCHIPKQLSLEFANQVPLWRTGYLRDYLMENKIDETIFRNILGSLGSCGEIFERPLETFSMGELKKVELTRSFLYPVDLLIWDEPLNYVDIAGRERIEEVIMKNSPTMIFVEHDTYFIDKIATSVVKLG